MEAKDVIIWRKEYKPGGLYAYKVYGRYQHIRAEDFAMIQVDNAYRKVWDSAVASLSVVEREANGVQDQFVLHWEVLWPRLFANRDYVYLRRHKEFNVQTRCLAYKAGIFEGDKACEASTPSPFERTSVHANAKRVSMEKDSMMKEETNAITDNKVYVIVSRSCVHPSVPESKNAIRVMEYWSHMVITTLNGPEKAGMEFVLTYYDEPAVGGLPTAVTTWAMGRAGPAFLERMRAAATDYRSWRDREQQDNTDFTPFGPEKVIYDSSEPEINEQDMESSKEGPDMEDDKRELPTHARPIVPLVDTKPKEASEAREASEAKEVMEASEAKEIKEPAQKQLGDTKMQPPAPSEEKAKADAIEINTENLELCEVSNKLEQEEKETEDSPEESQEESRRWWRYLYPFYYFI
ncbi:stAR-related lipid transfer protein 7, mitochondrial isoform X2 [Pectinophora gossypiella]|nr:stAR-related lipid transfer protein 7, mitochondrial isoform X2 [Pectinophora gossypiella]